VVPHPSSGLVDAGLSCVSSGGNTPDILGSTVPAGLGYQPLDRYSAVACHHQVPAPAPQQPFYLTPAVTDTRAGPFSFAAKPPDVANVTNAFSTIDVTDLFGASFQLGQDGGGAAAAAPAPVKPELYLGEGPHSMDQFLGEVAMLGQEGECVSLGSIDNVDFREMLRQELAAAAAQPLAQPEPPRAAALLEFGPDGLASSLQTATLMSYSPDILKLMASSQEEPKADMGMAALNGEMEAANFLPDASEDDHLMSLFSQSFDLMNSSEINKIYEAQ